MSLREQVISGLKWTASARLLGQLATWAITIVVMRLLTPADYGLLALATLFVGFLSLVSEIGLQDAVVQTKDLSTEELRSVFGAVILVNVVVAATIALLLAPLAATFFSEPRLREVMQVLSLQFLISSLIVIPTAMLERKLAYRGRSVGQVAATLIGSLTTLALAYSGAGVWALVGGSLCKALVEAVILNSISPFLELPAFAFSTVRHLIGYGLKVALTRLMWFVYSQADTFIIGKVLGQSPLGLYSVGMHLASLPAQRVSQVVNQMAFPAFSQARRERGDIRDHLLLAVRTLSFFAFPVFWGIGSIAGEIVDVFLGPKWTGAITPLALLALIMPLRILSPITHAALQAVGQAGVSLRNTLLACVVMPIAFLIGCQFGLTGVALGWVCAFPVVTLINLIRSLPWLGTTLGQYLLAMGMASGPGVIMYVVVTLTRRALNARPLPSLIVSITVGAAVYAAATYLANRKGAYEVLRLVRK